MRLIAIWENPNILSGTSAPPGAGGDFKADLGLCIIHQGLVTTEWAVRFKNLQMPSHIYMLNSNQPYDTGREGITRGVLSHGVKWVFHLDSVPNYTPIVVRDPITYNIDIKPISELGFFNGSGIERVDPIYPYEVLEHNKWCKINKVIRHPFKGILKRINTYGGTIDITANHSIYKFGQGNGESLADAGELQLGNHLVMTRYDWERRKKDTGLFFHGDDELAWLYGFFVAEGSITKDKKNISLSNNDEDLLQKAKEIFENNYNIKMGIIDGKEYTSKIQIGHKKLANYLYNNFYTDNKDKRIPQSILNSPIKIVESFLKGFLEGDGHITKQGIKSYHNNSQSVIQGLTFLLKRRGKEYNISTRPDKIKAVTIFEHIRKNGWYNQMMKLRDEAFKLRDERGWGATRIGTKLGISTATVNGWIYKGNKPKHNNSRRAIKEISNIPYRGYIYDLSTETHRFSAGIGPYLVHNTDNLIPINAVPLMMEWAEKFNLPLLSGLYWAKKPKSSTGGVPMPAAWLKMAEKPEENRIEFAPLNIKPHLASLPNKSPLVRCDVVGAGCLLIKADIFKKLDESNPNLPYFEWGLGRRDPTGKPLLQMSEDFFFCTRCGKELNIFPHVAIAIQCDHICNAIKRGNDGEFELLTLKG